LNGIACYAYAIGGVAAGQTIVEIQSRCAGDDISSIIRLEWHGSRTERPDLHPAKGGMDDLVLGRDLLVA
jgi:hypothetical protein